MAASIQGEDPGTQRAGGIAGLLGKKVARARGPSTAAYSEERDRAQESANVFAHSGGKNENLSYNYTQQGPTIQNQYQGQSRQGIAGNIRAQQTLANQLLNNQGEASKAQFQSNLDQSIAAQMSAANSTTGGAVAQAGAARNAAAQAAMMRAGASSEAARLGALERQAALGQAANVYNNIGGQLQNQYGLEQGSAIAQGQLDSANQAQQNQMRLGYGQLGLGYGQLENQANAQSLNALNSYTQGSLAAQGLSAGLKSGDAADTNAVIGTIAGLAGGAAGAVGGALGGKAAHGGAIGRAPNSIAEVYAPADTEARQHTASLAEALAGIEALKAELAGRARAGGGAMAQWERSFGSADKARADVQHSDNLAEAAKIREHFESKPKGPSIASALAGAGLAGLSRLESSKGPDWSEYMHISPVGARAWGGAVGGGVDMGNESGITGDMVRAASTGRAGDFAGKEIGMVGGGGISGGGGGPSLVGGGGGLAQTPASRLASALKGLR